MSSSKSSSKSGKIQFKGKSVIMKELQRCIAFRCYNEVLTSGNSKSNKELQTKMHSLYFGKANDEDNVSYSQQMLLGSQTFKPLFEVATDVARGTTTLVMKSCFHCTDETIVVSSNNRDKGINAAVLSSKGINNRSQITARSLWDMAKQVEKNGKKALAIVQLSNFKDGNLPSGKTFEDYLLFIRESMFREMKATPEYNAEDDEDDEKSAAGEVDADSAAEMPDSWFFPGYLAFVLWGPMVPPAGDPNNKAEAFFITDDPSKNTSKKSGGRAAARKRDAAEESVARSSASVSDGRGLNNSQALLAASIAQQSAAASMLHNSKMVDRQLHHYKSKIRRAEREVDRWRFLLTPDAILENDPTNLALQGFKAANAKLSKSEEELDTYMASVQSGEESVNRYQVMVDTTLRTFMPPDEASTTSIAKKQKRSTTPLSSIEIRRDASGNEDNDDNENENDIIEEEEET